jgi:hypothetical protein
MTVSKKTRVLNDNTGITVINNTSGTLIYISPRTQEEFQWAEYGDEHEMKLSELKTMKAQHRRFFDEQWIIFAEKDYDAIQYLKLEKFYKEIASPEMIEELFDLPVADFTNVLENATSNVKSLIVGKAREKYENGDLVNAHMIRAIEEKLNVVVDVKNPK